MAREHHATARSSDSFTQEPHSSAAATIGNPARATTAKHANNRYADERICMTCGLRTHVGRRSRDTPSLSRMLIRPLVGVAARMVHQRDWTLGFPVRVIRVAYATAGRCLLCPWERQVLLESPRGSPGVSLGMV